MPKTTRKKTAAKAQPKETTRNEAPPRKVPPKKLPPKKAPPRPATKAAPEEATKTTPAPARKPAKGTKPRSKKTTEATDEATAKPARKPTSKPAAKAKPKGSCGTGKCGTGSCPARKQLDGRSLFDRARECKDLEECRKFIAEFNSGIEQANQWLDDMHAQALSAEHARDLYGEQISDLLEAIDVDRARIAELEAELKNARTASPKSSATEAALDKLAELGREVQAIRRDLKRLLPPLSG